ncbi:MAG: hypothetical protein JSS83_25945 [Cyanobacteria bacterium SZAS LIN-3]|nr:hypothetical protein [Cyanobacteria bacterium SZAS LIN-3]
MKLIGFTLTLAAAASVAGCSYSGNNSEKPGNVESRQNLNFSGTSSQVSPGQLVSEQSGYMAHHGGTQTIRKAFVRQADVPTTTNDESNDQPVGHFGTATITVLNVSSGSSYNLDADIDGDTVQRIYFPKGGWVDFDQSEIDSAGIGTGTDEQGREWEFQGFESKPTVDAVKNEDSNDGSTDE